MQGLPLTRLLSRFAKYRQAGQFRSFQPALRVPAQSNAWPDFTYRALLVDAAGTLLVPSEPAAEVNYCIARRRHRLAAVCKYW